jgi:hydrogenase expression/formation protein HypD
MRSPSWIHPRLRKRCGSWNSSLSAMQTNDAFRNPEFVRRLSARIAEISRSPLKIMEFCGTHTHAVRRFGIREMLPESIELFSGPGCPVCVTDQADMDYAIALASIPHAIITTFGDLLKVPGTTELCRQLAPKVLRLKSSILRSTLSRLPRGIRTAR